MNQDNKIQKALQLHSTESIDEPILLALVAMIIVVITATILALLTKNNEVCYYSSRFICSCIFFITCFTVANILIERTRYNKFIKDFTDDEKTLLESRIQKSSSPIIIPELIESYDQKRQRLLREADEWLKDDKNRSRIDIKEQKSVDNHKKCIDDLTAKGFCTATFNDHDENLTQCFEFKDIITYPINKLKIMEIYPFIECSNFLDYHIHLKELYKEGFRYEVQLPICRTSLFNSIESANKVLAMWSEYLYKLQNEPKKI